MLDFQYCRETIYNKIMDILIGKLRTYDNWKRVIKEVKIDMLKYLEEEWNGKQTIPEFQCGINGTCFVYKVQFHVDIPFGWQQAIPLDMLERTRFIC